MMTPTLAEKLYRRRLRIERLEDRRMLAAGIWQGDLDATVLSNLGDATLSFRPGELKYSLTSVEEGNGTLVSASKPMSLTIPYTGSEGGADCSHGQIVLARNGTAAEGKVQGNGFATGNKWGWKGTYQGAFASDYKSVSGSWNAQIGFEDCDDVGDLVLTSQYGRWSSKGGFIGDIIAVGISETETGDLTFSYEVSEHALPTTAKVTVYWASGSTAADALSEITSWEVTATDKLESTVKGEDLYSQPRPVGASHVLLVADPTSVTVGGVGKFGEVVESNENNNLVAIQLDPEIAVSSIRIEGQPTSTLEVGYDWKRLSDQEVFSATGYWGSGSIESEADFDSQRLGQAFQIPAVDRDESKKFPVILSELSEKPPEATHLIVHLDSSGGFSGAYAEANELDNFATLDVRPDIVAESLHIDETTNDISKDEAVLQYSIEGLFPVAEFDVGLYFSVDGETPTDLACRPGVCTDRIAQQIQQTPGDNLSIHVPLDLLSAPPGSARYLIAVVDADESILGASGGKVAETDEKNNQQSTSIVPDAELVRLAWNYTQRDGGLDVEYRVRNRLWSSEGLNLSVDWISGVDLPDDDVRMAGGIVLPKNETHANIPAANLATPIQEHNAARGSLVWDSGDDPTPANNVQELAFENLVPTVEIEVTAGGIRKENFMVPVKIVNEAAINLNMDLSWEEEAPGDMMDTRTREKPTAARQMFADPIFVEALSDEVVDLGPFNRDWDWIPRDHPVFSFPWFNVTAAGITGGVERYEAKLGDWADVAKLAAGGVQIASLLVDIKDILETASKDPEPKTEASSTRFRAIVTAQAGGSAPVSGLGEGDLKLVVHPNRIDPDLKNFKAAHAKHKTALAASFALLAHPPAFAAAIVGTISSLKSARLLYLQALDPPDENYTEIAEPAPVLDIPQLSHDGFWQLQRENLAKVPSLLQAMAVARDRSHGARLAGSPKWEAAQLVALSDYATQLTILNGKNTLAATFADRWIKATASNEFQATKANLSANGLPDDARAELLRLGASEQQIQAFVDYFLSLDETGPTPAVQNTVDTILMSEYALLDIAEAVRIRTEELGAGIEAVSGKIVENLLDQRAHIFGQLKRELPTNRLWTDIANYITLVRSQILATNNLDVLRSHLEFGLGALAWLTLFDSSPTAVASYLRSSESTTLIGSDLADQLATKLQSADDLVGGGRFDEAITKLEEIDQLAVDSGADLGAAPLNTVLGVTRALRSTGVRPTWQNVVRSLDSNNDQFVSPVDALVILNRLNTNGESRLGIRHRRSSFLYDTNGDEKVSPVDALLVLNHLNKSVAAEGERTPDWFLFFDDIDHHHRTSKVAKHRGPVYQIDPVSAATPQPCWPAQIDQFFDSVSSSDNRPDQSQHDWWDHIFELIEISELTSDNLLPWTGSTPSAPTESGLWNPG